MGSAKYIGRIGALAARLGTGNVRRNGACVTASICAASLVVAAAIVVKPPSSESPAVKLSADATALIVCGTACPTPDAYWVDSVKNNFIAPTHPGQDINYVAVTTPQEYWPITGLARLIGFAVGDPKVGGLGGAMWPDEPWWKLSGLFDLTIDQSVRAGVADLEAAMAEHGDDHLVINGYSQGATVVNTVKRKLAEKYPAGTDAPDIDFVLGGDPNLPNGGLSARFPGLYVPILDLTFDGPAPTDTQFDTVEISRQYDMASDFPLYPLNVVASLNAVLGFVYLHTNPFDVSLPDDPTTSPAYQGTHGDTSYYFFETENLPLFAPLRSLGVPEPLIDVIEPFFRVLVELGYDRNIPLWEPTPARLIPEFDPAKVATDLVSAIGEGIANALAIVGMPPPPSSPAPVGIAAAAPAQEAADAGEASARAAISATTDSGTESAQQPATEPAAVASMPDVTTSAPASATDTESDAAADSADSATGPARATSGTTDSSAETSAGPSTRNSTTTSPSAGNSTESSPDTNGLSAGPSTPKPARLNERPAPRPVVRAPLRVRPQLRDVITHDNANQPATTSVAAGGDTESTASSSTESSSAGSSSAGSASASSGH